MTHLYRTTAFALAASAALAALPAGAADMVFTPSTGGGVVIESAPGTPALRVQPAGAVQLPGLPATPATATSAVCHDSNGTLGRCDPAQSGQGPQGPAGPAGTNGAPGLAGAPGAKGLSSLVATVTEPAGPNCATGGVRLQYGLDANDNGVLDTGEVNPALTRYVCHGAQGPQGPQGLPGTPGAGGGAGVTGLAEVRHGCFTGAAAITSGTDYTVDKDPSGFFTLRFNPVVGAGYYTVLLDGRTSTGRALALTTGGSVGSTMTLTPGWLDAGGETIASICFMLAR